VRAALAACRLLALAGLAAAATRLGGAKCLREWDQDLVDLLDVDADDRVQSVEKRLQSRSARRVHSREVLEARVQEAVVDRQDVADDRRPQKAGEKRVERPFLSNGVQSDTP
jgi:hypothetical protein